MTFATVRLRPTRFAFLIPYGDESNLRLAIQMNSFLWGGQFNPIIPVFKDQQPNLPDFLMKTIVPDEYLGQYLDNFDPDFLVPLGACEAQGFETYNREILSSSRMFSEVDIWRIPQHGIGLVEVLNHYAATEDKYLRRHPKKILTPSFSSEHSLFLASVFGEVSQEINEILKKDYLSYFEHESPTCDIANYQNMLSRRNLFLRRFTGYQIRERNNHPSLLLLDASDFLDIVDYWNFRALGLNVAPLAKQAVTEESIKSWVTEFLNDNYHPEKYPGPYHATFYHTHTSSYEESFAFIESLGIASRPPAQEARVGFSYLPPMGEFGFDNYIKPSIRPPIVKEAQFSTGHDSKSLDIKLVAPEFVSYPGVPGQHRFANEIELHTYHGKELMAEVFPEGRNVLALSFGGYDFTNWRFAKGKMIYVATFADHTLHIKLPLAEDTFFRWFQNSEFKTSISPAGRIAKQMLKNLGGLGGTWLLANERIFNLIGGLNWRPRKPDGSEKNIEESKHINYESLIGKLKEISNRSDFHLHRDPVYLLQKLLDSKILRLGITVNCTFCNQPSWYSIDEISYRIRCVNCLEEFSFPSHSPRADLKWTYRTIGAFSPAAQSYGSYAVLLALRFFAVTLNGRTTPIFGLEVAKKSSDDNRKNPPDADLTLFFLQNHAQTQKPDLIFVECKTYTEGFVQKDIDNMRCLADSFPNAYFVFATLEKSLKSTERDLIRSFVALLKDRQVSKNAPSRVITLTGLELYSNREPPRCWEGKLSTLPPAAANFSFVLRGLTGLCELTQQAHLLTESDSTS